MKRLFFLLVPSLLLCGCFISRPEYPKSWPAQVVVRGSCPDLSGTYLNDGQIRVGKKFGDVSLDSLLFTRTDGRMEISHVQI